VCDNGGPDVKPGLRDDLINERMQQLAKALPENKVFNDTAENASSKSSSIKQGVPKEMIGSSVFFT